MTATSADLERERERDSSTWIGARLFFVFYFFGIVKFLSLRRNCGPSTRYTRLYPFFSETLVARKSWVLPYSSGKCTMYFFSFATSHRYLHILSKQMWPPSSPKSPDSKILKQIRRKLNTHKKKYKLGVETVQKEKYNFWLTFSYCSSIASAKFRISVSFLNLEELKVFFRSLKNCANEIGTKLNSFLKFFYPNFRNFEISTTNLKKSLSFVCRIFSLKTNDNYDDLHTEGNVYVMDTHA